MIVSSRAEMNQASTGNKATAYAIDDPWMDPEMILERSDRWRMIAEQEPIENFL